jgi:hypothetical protein
MEAGWPTPMAGTPATEEYNEAGNNDSSRKIVALSGWYTPKATDGSKGGPNQSGGSLPNDVNKAGWATPRVGNNAGYGNEERGKRGDNCRIEDQAQMTHGLTANGSPAPMENTGVLASGFVSFLMGFSAEWMLCAPTTMKKGRK